MTLTLILLAAWDAGVNTWDAVDHREYAATRAWRQALAQVANARANGWGVPHPW